MPKVVILGAGFAGLTSALFLRNHGFDVEVYESQAESAKEGGTITIAPNGLRVISHLGLYSQLRARGFEYKALTLWNTSGQRLAEFPPTSRERHGFDCLRVRRSDIIDLLKDAARGRGVKIHYGRRCTGVTSETAVSASVGFEDGSTATADYIIGADGMRSRIRDHVAPSSVETGLTYAGKVQISGFPSDEALKGLTPPQHIPAIILGRQGPIGMMLSSPAGTELGFGYTATVPSMTRDEWDVFSKDKAGLMRILRDVFIDGEDAEWVHPYIKAVINATELESLLAWQFTYSPPIDEWYSTKHAKVFILGDAAHGTPPSGQGANMSLEDAETLAWALSEMSHADPATTTTKTTGETANREGRDKRLARAWWEHRKTRVAKALGTSSKAANQLRGGVTGWQVQTAKEWALWLAAPLMGWLVSTDSLFQYDAESVRAVLE